MSKVRPGHVDDSNAHDQPDQVAECPSYQVAECPSYQVAKSHANVPPDQGAHSGAAHTRTDAQAAAGRSMRREWRSKVEILPTERHAAMRRTRRHAVQ